VQKPLTSIEVQPVLSRI